jgi:hypothetical protein
MDDVAGSWFIMKDVSKQKEYGTLIWSNFVLNFYSCPSTWSCVRKNPGLGAKLF